MDLTAYCKVQILALHTIELLNYFESEVYKVTVQERTSILRKRNREYLGISKARYNWFKRMAEALREVYIFTCNEEVSEEDIGLVVSSAEQEIFAKAGGMGLYAYLQTDPRGASLYLDIKPIESNAYNKARCIY